MSAYMKFSDIQFANAATLIAALEAIGYTVEVGQALSLYGFQGDKRPETAQIVVRRQQIGRLANDLGFAWNGQAFVPIISQYDAGTNLNEDWRNKLQAMYSKYSVTRWLEQQDARVQQVRYGEDGMVFIRATVEV